jgi:hypothetical protein
MIGQRLDTTGGGGEVRRFSAAACPACGGVVILELTPEDAVVSMRPESIGEWEVGHVPDAVRPSWDEAVKVFRVGANGSAVVMCGRTLEAAADARSVTGRNLNERIKTMLDQGLITTEFKEAMTYIRLIRNVGAHAGQDVSHDSAEGTMRFTQQTLRLLFEVPGELHRLTQVPAELAEDEGVDGEGQA